MTSLRWWHTAVLGMAVALAALVLLGYQSVPGFAGLGAVAAFALTWFALGPRALRNRGTGGGYAVILILIAGVGTALAPNFATIQCVAFPLLWSLIESRKRAIVANFALAAAVGVGLYLATGDLAQAVAVEAVSFALSLALGLWISGIAEQSEERRRLLDELHLAQEKLAALNRDAGVSSERERLAREIHDTIAQDLTGLVMLAQRARRELGDSASGTLATLEESARATLLETRTLVAASSSVTLGGGLAEALARLAERVSRETGMPVELATGELPPLPRETEIVLLRCAQEGLANVRKHANASAAYVTVTAADGAVALRVADDGQGFDPNASAHGFGLGGMRERLALVDGSLEVASSPAGTVLTASLPISTAVPK
jgi:signal transduction histidine kinase